VFSFSSGGSGFELFDTVLGGKLGGTGDDGFETVSVLAWWGRGRRSGSIGIAAADVLLGG
jgi:hypothetical protein